MTDTTVDTFVQYHNFGSAGHVVHLSTDTDNVPVEIAHAMGKIVVSSTIRIYPGCIEYINPDWRPDQDKMAQWVDRVVKLLQQVPAVHLLFVAVSGEAVYRNPDW